MAAEEPIVDEIVEGDAEEEVEEERLLLPLMFEAPNFETDVSGNREDGRLVKRDEDAVIGVAEEGCVGDEDAAPVDFWLLSEPPTVALLS